MQNNYNFITNFDINRLSNIKIALLAADITGYKFCKTAMDANGNIMPDCYALYFEKSVTPKEIELFITPLAS